MRRATGCDDGDFEASGVRKTAETKLTKPMDESKTNKIDDRLISADASTPKKPEPPKVYAITDLRKYVKPPMSEELGKSDGGLVDLDSVVVCTCVPVETCVCHVVTYNVEATDCGCTGTCPCTGTCGGTCCYSYWRPY
jgi:hypothetical protein